MGVVSLNTLTFEFPEYFEMLIWLFYKAASDTPLFDLIKFKAVLNELLDLRLLT